MKYLTLLFLLVASLLVTEVTAQDKNDPTVGAPGSITQVILPGTELVGKPLVDGSPMVVRVVEAFPHGDSFRYDLRFHGMEPGRYDLSKWLRRKDGTSADDLPKIPVEIRSLLPPGQIEPNELATGWLPRMGGYRNVMIAVIALWSLILLGLIFGGRKQKDAEKIEERNLTLADLLQERIESAFQNEMDPKKYAELERMLIGFWRKRLNLESVPTHEALAKIKSDEEAGPLIKQIETWMHSPNADKNVDLPKLLEPFRKLPADTMEFQA